MKNIMKTLTAALVVTTALVVSVSAANFEHCADSLKSMGLFQGGTNGYELDRAPTRAEAATMLVRLLGKEADAKKLEYTAPFTDLEGWESPYIQYLYDNKLTTGSTATTFDPTAKCDAKMYTTFLLRALGYSDAEGADFTYDKSIDKAKEIGLIDGMNCDEKNFLRDNVVAMSYTALAEMPKDQSADTLLEKLVKDGAVTAEAAKPMLSLMDNYDAYAALSAQYATQTKMSMDVATNVDAALNGTNMLKMTMNMNMAMDMNMTEMNKSKIAMTGKTKMELNKALIGEGEEATMEMPMNAYFTDGNYYVNDGTNKLKMPMDFDAALAAMGDMSSVSAEPFSGITSIVKNGNSYTVKYASGALSSLVNSTLASLDLSSMGASGLSVSEVSSTVTATNDKISAMDMNIKMSMTIEGQAMDMTMLMKTSNIKVGSDVTVTLPTDLSTYKTIEEAAAA